MNIKQARNDELLLLQINDSLFPIGAYSHSYGLETYIQRNLVYDQTTFLEYMHQNVKLNLKHNDLLAAYLGFQAATANNLAEIQKLDSIISATKFAPELLSASNKLCSRFIKTVAHIVDQLSNSSYDNYLSMIKKNLCSGHYALVYGIFCGSLTLDSDRVLLNFAYSQVSGIITNGVKLIPLSQNKGQQILSLLHPIISQVLDDVKLLTIDDLGLSTPGFELRAMQHEYLYSRLYMS